MFCSCDEQRQLRFSHRLLFDESVVESSWNSEFSRDLAAMNEESLFSDTSTSKEVWRLTVIGSFAQPYCFRAEIVNAIGDSGKLIVATYKEGNRTSADKTIPSFVIQSTAPIDFDSSINARWNTFQRYVKEYDFWNQPTKHDECDFDRAHSILEARVDGKYHAIMSCTGFGSNSK
jgi:hypothetical protein